MPGCKPPNNFEPCKEVGPFQRYNVYIGKVFSIEYLHGPLERVLKKCILNSNQRFMFNVRDPIIYGTLMAMIS